ncbi:HD domain-containing protein [Sporosarcina sp. BI001-red]|uniref:HD domain-containing protein n=1 Tax=Sporosarcina sp. BI001-red TaxID=2282866 RepID=UPI000E2248D2|nr:HD domain-containing protein [Sporosarcina sp. BI001-red]REB09938.1 HD domain-containing protein [Sporosarcina sp. BI001-red]
MTYSEQCASITKEIYEKFDASHDFDHILRVLQNAYQIMEGMDGVDRTTVELAVYLHDVDDPKYAEVSGISAAAILKELAVPQDLAHHVLATIDSVSFSGGNSKDIESPEGAIVRDADRLDAIGAIGIARTFAYGGAKGRKLYDPKESIRSVMSEHDYRSKKTASVTHFHEKLFLLKELMITERGKQLAEDRHQFMKQFVRQLEIETGQSL